MKTQGAVPYGASTLRALCAGAPPFGRWIFAREIMVKHGKNIGKYMVSIRKYRKIRGELMVKHGKA